MKNETIRKIMKNGGARIGKYVYSPVFNNDTGMADIWRCKSELTDTVIRGNDDRIHACWEIVVSNVEIKSGDCM